MAVTTHETEVQMKRSRWQRCFTAGALVVGAVLGSVGNALALKEGDPAPAFSVQSTTGKPISSKEFLGKKSLVVFFYYACFTNT
jgi:cytochrome oxidase Cu insertion factor (SCO1/SenC/PrrC family)